MSRVKTWQILHFVISTEAPKKGNETSSSQCLLGKNNKKGERGGAAVSEGHEGTANRRLHSQPVSRSVSGTNNLQLCLTQTDNATTHQSTLPAAVTVYQGGRAGRPSALSADSL